MNSRNDPLPRKQRYALRVLGEMLAKIETRRGMPAWVHVDAWREELEDQGVIDPNDKKHRTQAWERIWLGLRARRLLAIRNKRVRMASTQNHNPSHISPPSGGGGNATEILQ